LLILSKASEEGNSPGFIVSTLLCFGAHSLLTIFKAHFD
jgi:hypothetical protein